MLMAEVTPSTVFTVSESRRLLDVSSNNVDPLLEDISVEFSFAGPVRAAASDIVAVPGWLSILLDLVNLMTASDLVEVLAKLTMPDCGQDSEALFEDEDSAMPFSS